MGKADRRNEVRRESFSLDLRLNKKKFQLLVRGSGPGPTLYRQSFVKRARRAKLVLELVRFARTRMEWGLCPPEFAPTASNEDGMR